MQDSPNHSIRLVTVRAGGGVDFVARFIAQGIADRLGRPVFVDNQESTTIAAEIVAKAQPDGYTLLHLGPSFWTTPLLKKVPYDPVQDFLPITLAITQPNILVAHPSVAANSIAELIALAHARPAALKYASGLTGTSSHLAGGLFTHMAGVDIVRVPYKNTALAGLSDLFAGKVQLMFFSVASGMPHVKAGKLRALAVTSAEPSALVPGLPTVAATLPGYESVHMQGIFAPAKTPLTVIKRLNQEIVQFLKTAVAKERLFSSGIEAIGTTPEEFAAKMTSEIARLDKVIKAAGIKADKPLDNG